MPDWEDPTIYTAIVGAMAGLAALGMRTVDWLDKRKEAKAKLGFHVDDWGILGRENDLLVVGMRFTNPSSGSNVLTDIGICIGPEGAEQDFPLLNPNVRTGLVEVGPPGGTVCAWAMDP